MTSSVGFSLRAFDFVYFKIKQRSLKPACGGQVYATKYRAEFRQ